MSAGERNGTERYVAVTFHQHSYVEGWKYVRERARHLQLQPNTRGLIFIFPERSRLINTNDKLKIVYVIMISSPVSMVGPLFLCVSDQMPKRTVRESAPHLSLLRSYHENSLRESWGNSHPK